MKRAMLALALGLSTLSLTACDDYGYGYGGGVYSAGYPHYRYYDDYYYAPAYRGYWGRGGHYYHRQDGYHHRRDGDVRGHRSDRQDGVSRPGRDQHWRDRQDGRGGHGRWRRDRD